MKLEVIGGVSQLDRTQENKGSEDKDEKLHEDEGEQGTERPDDKIVRTVRGGETDEEGQGHEEQPGKRQVETTPHVFTMRIRGSATVPLEFPSNAFSFVHLAPPTARRADVDAKHEIRIHPGHLAEQFDHRIPGMRAAKEPGFIHPARTEGINGNAEDPIGSADPEGDGLATQLAGIPDHLDACPGDPGTGHQGGVTILHPDEVRTRILRTDHPALEFLA